MSILPTMPTHNGTRYVGANPKLYVTVEPPTPETVIHYQVWETTGQDSLVWSSSPYLAWRPNGTSYWESPSYVPTGVLVDGEPYKWRARAKAGYEPYGDWSAWSTMTADLTAPAGPTVASASYPEGVLVTTGGPGDFIVTSTTTGKDASLLCYRLDTQTRQCDAGGGLADGHRAVTVTLTPAEGWHTLDASTVDYAGNASAETTYAFGYATDDPKVLGPDYESYPTEPVPSPSPAPTPTGDPSTPPTVGGTFTLPDGTGAAGFTVSVYPTGAGEFGPLAQTTTGANGSWSVALTSLSPELQAEAAANGGVLNVRAEVLGRATSGRIFNGSMHVQAGVAAGGSLTEEAVVAREAARFSAPMLPVLTELELPPQPTAAEYQNSFASNEVANPTTASGEDADWDFYSFLPATTPSRTPVNPYLVGAVDYTNVAVTPINGGGVAAPGARLGGRAGAPQAATVECVNYGSKTVLISSTTQYTSVGEYHAYWDAKGKAVYVNSASTDISVGITYNYGSTWGAGGAAHVGNYFGLTLSSGTNGPYSSRELDIPIIYDRYRIWTCDVYNGVWRYMQDYVQARRVYVPSGWYPSRLGANISYMDGYYKWSLAPYKYVLYPGNSVAVSSGYSRGYSWAASLFGFGPTAKTLHSTSRKQVITAGTVVGPRHDIFTHKCLTCSPPAIYSY